jgi:hypothetical protein
MQQPEWNWGTPNVLPLPNCKDKQKFEPNCFKCNDELVKSMIFDAVVTNDFENQKSPRSRGKDGDEDGDGVPDAEDLDDDNDGIPDAIDNDDDNDGIPDDLEDEDGDGVPDAEDLDDDNDGIPDAIDNDDDNDGIPDELDGDNDDDNDGIPDAIDNDDDNDGIPDELEGDDDDKDGDGVPDSEDLDDDNDGIPDAEEAELQENLDQIYKKFGIQLAFIATRSGLMRYSDHSALFRDPNYRPKLDPDIIPEPPFADINNKAIEEVWYKRAVDYHIKDPKAFVYSVPFDVGKKKTQVTASHAIMVGKGNQKSPAAVAGMQIDYGKFRQMFFDQTKGKCGTNGDLACYVVDNNGFVIISDDPVHTGKFFGEVDGTILDSLIQHQIYKTIQIYDYQAICLEREDDGSSANFLLSPFKMMAAMFNYILGQIAWTIIRFEIHHLWNPDWTYAFPQGLGELETDQYDMMPDADVSDDMGGTDYYDPLMDEFSIKDGGRIPLLKMTYINKTSPRPCDKQVTLYELNEASFTRGGKTVPVKGKLTNCHSSECERPFSVNLIPHTNLIMIVADKTCPCFSTKISIEPTKVEYGPANETAYCERLKYSIYRRKPTHCLNYHAEETEIKLCGGSSNLSASAVMLALTIFVQGWITSSSSRSTSLLS